MHAEDLKKCDQRFFFCGGKNLDKVELKFFFKKALACFAKKSQSSE